MDGYGPEVKVKECSCSELNVSPEDDLELHVDPNHGPPPRILSSRLSRLCSTSNLFLALLYVWTCLCLVTILLPFFIAPVLLYRWLVVRCFAALFRPDLQHILRHHGALYLLNAVHMEPDMNWILSLRLEGSARSPPDFERTKALIVERFVHARSPDGGLLYPELQQHLVKWWGFFFWVRDPSFSVDHHIRRRRLISGGGGLADAEVEFMREPFAPKRSPWQVLVLETAAGEERGNSGGAPAPVPAPYHHLVFKFHHVLADGYSGIRAVFQCADVPPEPAYLPPPPPPSSRLLLSPFLVVLELAKMQAARLTPPGAAGTLPWGSTPRELMPRTGTRRQFIELLDDGGAGFSLAGVKAVAKRHGVSVNAVVHAALAGALRKFLLPRYGDGPTSIPACIRFPQAVPVPAHPEGLCNLGRVVTYELPLGVRDRRARLLLCHRMLGKGKESMEAHAFFLAAEFCARLPALGIFQWLILQLQPHAPIGTTSLPGPLAPVSFKGQHVTRARCALLGPNVPFYIFMFSYAGAIQVSCNGDKRVFKDGNDGDLKEILRLLVEEVKKLETD